MPYGETTPKTVTLANNQIAYTGTAKLSQLEVPFVVELTATGNQSNFYLEIGDNRFTYSQSGNISAGDIFKIMRTLSLNLAQQKRLVIKLTLMVRLKF